MLALPASSTPDGMFCGKAEGGYWVLGNLRGYQQYLTYVLLHVGDSISGMYVTGGAGLAGEGPGDTILNSSAKHFSNLRCDGLTAFCLLWVPSGCLICCTLQRFYDDIGMCRKETPRPSKAKTTTACRVLMTIPRPAVPIAEQSIAHLSINPCSLRSRGARRLQCSQPLSSSQSSLQP